MTKLKHLEDVWLKQGCDIWQEAKLELAQDLPPHSQAALHIWLCFLQIICRKCLNHRAKDGKEKQLSYFKEVQADGDMYHMHS